MTRSTVQPFQPKQSNHGHKRKGKPVEAWMLELEKAQDQESGLQSLDLTAIKQIADGVEQMVFSWGLDKQERGQEYAKLSKSLAKENRHVVLPWSLDKTEEGLDSASEMDILALNNDMKETLENPAPTSTQPQLPTACAVIETRSASPKLAEVKKRENTWLDNFGSCRDRSLSLESASEDPQPRKEHAEAKTYNRFKCDTDSCMNTTDGVGSCNIQISTGENLLGFETRARENSCQKMTPEHWSNICESIDGGIGERNVASSFCTDTSKRGDNPSHANETELRSCLGEGSPIWIEEVAPPTPEGISQQPVMNQTRNQYPPPILTHKSAGNASSLLSQSLSCAQSPLPQPEIAQCSEASKERDRLPAGTDPQMCSPINANEPKGSPPLHFSASNSSCREDTESVEVGGHTIKMTALRGGNDVLEDKFQTLVNINAGSLGVQEHNQLIPSPTTDVEELQIALLECAMEYEIKTIEAKMKMQKLKLKGHQNVVVAKSEQICPQKAFEPSPTHEVTIDGQRSQQLKKQMAKLQHEKSTLGNELNALKKKERQFEMQKRSLEEALLRVNRLQREVLKKEQEVVEWQLKEKETKAQLQEVDERLKRERHAQMSQPLEPKKLLTLLPALRDWLRSLKKVGMTKAAERRIFQDKEELGRNYPYLMDGSPVQAHANFHSRDKGFSPCVPAHLDTLGQLGELAKQSNRNLSVNQVDVIIGCLSKEIHALQMELTKLARS